MNGFNGCGAMGVLVRLTDSGDCEVELLPGEFEGLGLLTTINFAHGFLGLIGGLASFVGVGVLLSSGSGTE
jgi:hypothetical protein